MNLLRTLASSLLAASAAVHADEAAIRRNLPARLPDLPRIDAVSRSEIAGLWEVRLGSELIYTDGDGAYVLEGELIDARRHVNLTAARERALKAFDFASLPLQDAITWKRGSGARHLVVFADPNCGYCKQLERTLNGVPDVTVHTFLIPILGEDSVAKAQALWCAPRLEQGRLWREWMTKGTTLPRRAACDTSAIERNLALQSRHGISGTPTLVFANNERVAGVLDGSALEQRLATRRQAAAQ